MLLRTYLRSTKLSSNNSCPALRSSPLNVSTPTYNPRRVCQSLTYPQISPLRPVTFLSAQIGSSPRCTLEGLAEGDFLFWQLVIYEDWNGAIVYRVPVPAEELVRIEPERSAPVLYRCVLEPSGELMSMDDPVVFTKELHGPYPRSKWLQRYCLLTRGCFFQGIPSTH